MVMPLDDRLEPTAPNGLRVRPFGTCVEDLAIDLASDDRPRAVTDVLAACVLPARDVEFYWDLPISSRTGCLLILAALDGAAAVDVEFRCPDCGEPLEISLTIDELLDQERSAVDRVTLVSDAGTVTELRRPTGRDQAIWAAGAFADAGAVRQAMASRLSDTGVALDDAALDRLERALDEADPLLRAAVDTSCPECGHVSEHDVDLTEYALGRLRRAQDSLLETVHLLASRYHWSEAEILAMPPWRRRRYVAMLERETRP